MLVVYGSGGAGTEVSEHYKSRICSIIDAYASFYNSKVGVLTGGGPNVMEKANKHAQEEGHLSGSAVWNIPSERPNGYADFLQYYDQDQLQARQDLMWRHSDVVLFGPGGMGTNYEIGIESVPIKLGFEDKPLFFLGTEFWGSFRKHLDFLVSDGRVSEKIYENAFFIDTADEFLTSLSSYYHINKE
jgi:predicted Rossmann-fold nucleotide-binding protein